jgi:hypothetical protein
MIPGLLSGNQWKSTPCSIDELSPVVALMAPPETTGEKMIRMIADPSPPYMLHSAPRVLNRRQNSE